MSKMVQIRNVPDAVHGKLKERAAREGMSLSDYLKQELEHMAARPSQLEWLERVAKHKPIRMKQSAAELIRELRDGK